MTRNFAAACLAAIAIGFGGNAAAESLTLVDGTVWTASSEQEKEAYLVGAANFLSVEYIVQSKADQRPTDQQSSIGRWWSALEHISINEAMAVIDDWYEVHPDRLGEPVLVVIWNSYVETD